MGVELNAVASGFLHLFGETLLHVFVCCTGQEKRGAGGRSAWDGPLDFACTHTPCSQRPKCQRGWSRSF